MINTVSGDVSLRYLKSPKKIKMNSVSGDFELEVAKAIEAGKINTVSGDTIIRMRKSDVPSIKLSTMSGDLKAPGFDVESKFGSAKLSAKTDYEFEANTVSGDIEVRTN